VVAEVATGDRLLRESTVPRFPAAGRRTCERVPGHHLGLRSFDVRSAWTERFADFVGFDLHVLREFLREGPRVAEHRS
jgi:hypothetical protein